ncbi:putative serine/threonine-protein kinase-like protein CCR3 [Hordeum vulgare]|nr:putative serine/threonine-protein kinase-like protein CCR3 [Hordeum vulgare]
MLAVYCTYQFSSLLSPLQKFQGNREQKTGAIYSRLLVRVSSPLHSVAMDLWTGLGQAATMAQLVGADVGGLISMIVQAAISARQNKSECKQLPRRVHAACWPCSRCAASMHSRRSQGT